MRDNLEARRAGAEFLTISVLHCSRRIGYRRAVYELKGHLQGKPAQLAASRIRETGKLIYMVLEDY